MVVEISKSSSDKQPHSKPICKDAIGIIFG